VARGALASSVGAHEEAERASDHVTVIGGGPSVSGDRGLFRHEYVTGPA
jgi:hypothetical protein